MLKLNSIKKNLEFWGILIILVLSFTTRFVNLGYSDYIGDEHKAFYQPEHGQSMQEFFLTRRKGPMQFIVSHIPYSFTHDFRNELAQRIPFSIFSVFAVIAFYAFVREFTSNKLVAFFSTLLFLLNGFIVGFGRIAQYQNLNLFFSLTALYFYTKIVTAKSNQLVYSLLGTLMWSLSVLSHWDAVFILPVVVIIFLRFLFSKKYPTHFKIKLIVINFVLRCVLLLPFLVPYTKYQMAHESNMRYFQRRVDTGVSNVHRYVELFKLYNPFIVLEVLLGMGALGFLFYKKTYSFSIWFLFSFLLFELLIRKPGTHIYNFLLPVFVLAGYSFQALVMLDKVKMVTRVLSVIIFSFFIWQTHYIFIDHLKEYPWEQKIYYDFTEIQDKQYKKEHVRESERSYTIIETPKYTIDSKLPLFGFAHRRNWDEINDFINHENSNNDENLGYMSNEVKTISEWYMDTQYQADGSFYVVGVKKPLSFSNDWKMGQIGGKKTVHEVKNDQGATVVRIS